MSTEASTQLPPSDADAVFSECLANARLTALRALLETVNTTDDPLEKRRAATAILRISDPATPRSRVPRLSEPGSARTPDSPAPHSPNPPRHAPGPQSPYDTAPYADAPPRAANQPTSTKPDPEIAGKIEALLAQVAAEEDDIEGDDKFLDSITDLHDVPALNIGKAAARMLAAAAGKPAPRSRPSRRAPPS